MMALEKVHVLIIIIIIIVKMIMRIM